MLKKLIVWAFLLRAKPMEPNKAGKIALALFKLDSDSEFFHLITTEDSLKTEKPEPYEIYWQSVAHKTVYGPFTTIHNAMQHYTWTIATRKQEALTAAKVPGPNVIQVDFKARKRIIK